MEQTVCGAVVAVLVVLPAPGVCSTYLYAPRPSPADPNQERSDGVIGGPSVWDFPYKFEEIPITSERKSDVTVSDPRSDDTVDGQFERSDGGTVTSVPHLPSQHRSVVTQDNRPEMQLRPFTDPRFKFLEVMAVVAVKIIMSTALASWFLVAGQLLFVIADITGSSEIFGNRSPLTFVFQALPLIEVLLKGSADFHS